MCPELPPTPASTGPEDRADLPLHCHPLTPARWPDLEALFLARGCAQARNCWCMYYRRSGPTPRASGERKADVERAALRALVDAGHFTGLLAYRGSTPVGWLSFGPREDFAKLAKSPVMKPVDAQPVWSVICFVVPPAYRRQGVSAALLAAAQAEARRRRVTLEAYPVDHRTAAGEPATVPDDNLWFGPLGLYERAGFQEVARRKPTRVVVRSK